MSNNINEYQDSPVHYAKVICILFVIVVVVVFVCELIRLVGGV